MTAQMAIILKQYDEHSMSIEDIVEDSNGEYEMESVKAVLAQYSRKYRDALKGDSKNRLDFTDDEAEMAKQAISGIMQSTDDDYLKFRTAKYMLDDKKGRLDAANIKGINIDIMTFNIHIKQAKEARERTMGMIKRPTDKVIEVESNTTKAA